MRCEVTDPARPNNGRCAPPLAEGANCVDSQPTGTRPPQNLLTACAPGTVCDLQTGVCARPFSRAVGQQFSSAAGCSLSTNASLAFDP